MKTIMWDDLSMRFKGFILLEIIIPGKIDFCIRDNFFWEPCAFVHKSLHVTYRWLWFDWEFA